MSRAHRLCTPDKLQGELCNIRKFMSWNCYPLKVVNNVLKKLNEPKCIHRPTEDSLIKIWVGLTYLGKPGEYILRRCLNKVIKFITLW